MDDQPDVARFGAQPALRHHAPRAEDGQRHHRQARLNREQKAARLELGDAAVAAARTLGIDDQGQPFRHERTPAREDAPPIGVVAIDEQMAAALQMPAQHREAGQRLLRDDAQLVRQAAEDDGRVVVALVIGDVPYLLRPDEQGVRDPRR